MQLKSLISFQSDNRSFLSTEETEVWRNSSTFHLFPPEYPTKAKDQEHILSVPKLTKSFNGISSLRCVVVIVNIGLCFKNVCGLK